MDLSTEHPMKVAKNILCKGRVQGVFFRASTKEHAISLGLCGWVKNLLDGSVLAHAEGAEVNVNKLVDWCRIGSANAIVDSVIVNEAEVNYYISFEIIH